MSLAIMLNVIDNPTQQYESALEYEEPVSSSDEPKVLQVNDSNQEDSEKTESEAPKTE